MPFTEAYKKISGLRYARTYNIFIYKNVNFIFLLFRDFYLRWIAKFTYLHVYAEHGKIGKYVVITTA
jgi:hypothetical protein